MSESTPERAPAREERAPAPPPRPRSPVAAAACEAAESSGTTCDWCGADE